MHGQPSMHGLCWTAMCWDIFLELHYIDRVISQIGRLGRVDGPHDALPLCCILPAPLLSGSKDQNVVKSTLEG